MPAIETNAAAAMSLSRRLILEVPQTLASSRAVVSWRWIPLLVQQSIVVNGSDAGPPVPGCRDAHNIQRVLRGLADGWSRFRARCAAILRPIPAIRTSAAVSQFDNADRRCLVPCGSQLPSCAEPHPSLRGPF